MLFVHNYQWKVNGRNFSWKETHFHRRGKPIFFYFSTGGVESFREPMLRWGHWDTKPHAQKFSAFPIETLAVEPESYFPIYWGPLVHSIQQKEKGRGCSSPVLSWLMFKSTLKLGKSVGFLCYLMFSLSFFSFFFLGNSTFWHWVLMRKELRGWHQTRPASGTGATAVQIS